MTESGTEACGGRNSSRSDRSCLTVQKAAYGGGHVKAVDAFALSSELPQPSPAADFTRIS